MKHQRPRRAVMAAHRSKLRLVLSNTHPTKASVGAVDEAALPDRNVSHHASVNPAGVVSSAGETGAERESNPRVNPPTPGHPPSGPRIPLVHLRPQPSPQTICLAFLIAIVIVWLGVIAVIAAWSNR